MTQHNHPIFKAYKDGKLILTPSFGIYYNATLNPNFADEIRLFTDMYDSNGEPIYEGDTLIVKPPSGKNTVYVYQGSNGCWEVKGMPLTLRTYIDNHIITVTLFTERRAETRRETVRFIYAGNVLDEANPKQPTRHCEHLPIGRRSVDDRRQS